MELRLCFLVALSLFAFVSSVPVRNYQNSNTCSTQCSNPRNLIYVPGKTYVYEYNSLTRLSSKNDEDLAKGKLYAKLYISVHSPCDFSLQMKDVKVEGDDNVGDLKADLERHPLMFAYDDGKIQHVCADPSEKEYILNTKKAALGYFLVTPSDLKEGEQVVSEQDGYGTCDVKYVISKNGKTVRLTKNFDAESCDFGSTTWETFMPENVEGRFAQELRRLPLLSGSGLCKIEISDKVVRNSECSWHATPAAGAENNVTLDINEKIQFLRIENHLGAKKPTRFERQDILFKREQQKPKQCSTHCSKPRNVMYETGKTYVYEYNSMTALNLKNNEDLGKMKLYAKLYISVHSPCDFSLQMRDVEIQDLENDSNELKAELERHSMMFSYDDGKVQNVCAHPDEKEYILNLKKATLGYFQITPSDLQEGQQVVREQDIYSNCEVKYDVSKNGKSIRITKTADQGNCEETGKTWSIFFPEQSTDSASEALRRLPIINDNVVCKIELNDKIIKNTECQWRGGLMPVPSSNENATLDINEKIQLLRVENNLHNEKLRRFDRQNTLSHREQHVHKANQCSTHCSKPRNLIYVPGKTYVYEYDTLTKFVPKSGEDQGEKATLQAKLYISVHSPCDFSLKMKDVKVDGLEYGSKLKADLERHSLMFSYNDGKIQHVCAHPSEEQYILNIKKSSLAYFLVTPSDLKEREQVVKEQDIYGSDDVKYVISSNGETVRLTKTLVDGSYRSDRTWDDFLPQDDDDSFTRRVRRLPLVIRDPICEIEITEKVIKNSECKYQVGEARVPSSNANATVDIEEKIRFLRIENTLQSEKLESFDRQNILSHREQHSHKSNQCSTQCSKPQNLIYETGKTYVYEYNSMTRLNLKNDDLTRVKFQAKIHISVHSPCEFSLQLRDVKVDGLDYGNTLKAALERHPMMFAYDDGTIQHVCADPSEEEYILNIKKAALAYFMITPTDLKQGEQVVREQDVFGTCDVKYIISNKGKSVEVTKKVDDKSCKHGEKTWSAFFPQEYDDSFSNSVRRLPVVTQDALCKVQITDKIIRNIDCSWSAGAIPLAWSQTNATLDVNDKIRFLRVENDIQAKKPNKFERRNLLFKSTQHLHKATESQVSQLLNEICVNSKNEITDRVPRLFAELVHSVRSLSFEEIRRLWQKVESKGICENSAKLRDIFTDALVMDASESSLKMVAEMIENREVSTTKANFWLSMLTFANQPTESGLRALLPLLKSQNVHTQAYLGISAYAHNLRELNGSEKEESQVVGEVVDTIWSRFEKLNQEKDSEELVVILRAISNLRALPTEISKFESLIHETKYSTAIRVAAIEAVERSLHKNREQLDKMLQLVQNQNENAEIRIAAYRAIIHNARRETVKALVEMLNNETSNQVGSYIVSHMLNMQETSDPHKQHIREALNDVAVPKDRFKRDMHRYSRNYEYSHLFEKMNLGAVAEGDIIFDRSYIPRSVRANLTLPMFGRSLNVLEVGVRQQGAENVLEKIAGPNSFMRNNNMTETMRAIIDVIRSGNQEGKSIEIPRFVEQIETSTYIRVDGKYIAQMSLNDTVEVVKEIRKLLESYGKSLKTWTDKEGQDRAFSFMLMDTAHEISAPNGVPVRVDMNATVVLGYKLADRTFYPSFAGEFSARMGFKHLINNHHLAGIKYVSTISSAPAIKADIEYKNEVPYKLRLEMPSENMKILSLKSRVLEIDNNGNEKEIEIKTRKHEGCSKTLSKALGIQLCTKVQLPSPIVTFKAPFTPLNGAIDFELTVRKSDMQMKGYEIELELPTKEGEWHSRVAFNTPGSKENRKFEVELYTKFAGDNRQLNFALTVPGKNILFKNYIGVEDKRLRASAALEVNSDRFYLIDAIVNQEQNGDKITYKPEVTMVWLRHEPARYSGIVKYDRSTVGDKVKRNIDITVSDPQARKNVVEAKIQLGSTSERQAIAVNMKINHRNLKVKINSQNDLAKKGTHRQFQTTTQVNYEVRGVSNNVDVKIMMQDISTKETVKYVNLFELKNERYPLLNGKVAWSFMNKLGKEIQNELNVVRESAQRVVQFKQSLRYNGLEQGKTLAQAHQLIAVEIPSWNINGEVEAKSHLEMSKTPKFKIAFTALNKKTGKDAKLSYEFNYVSEQPLKISMDAALKFNQIEVTYTDRFEQVKPNEYKGDSLLVWSKTKNAKLEYVYRVDKTDAKKHYELDASFNTHSMQKPITHRAAFDITADELKVKSQLEFKGKQIWNTQMAASRVGKSNLDLETALFNVKFDAQPFGENRQAKFEISHPKSKFQHSTSIQISKTKGSASFASQTSIDTQQIYKMQAHISRTQPSNVVVESRLGSIKMKLDFTKPQAYAGMYDIKAADGSYVQGQFAIHDGEKVALKNKAVIAGKFIGLDAELKMNDQSYLKIETSQVQTELKLTNRHDYKKITFLARDKKDSWKHESEIAADIVKHDYTVKSVGTQNNQEMWNINGEYQTQKPGYTAKMMYKVGGWGGRVSATREQNGKQSLTVEAKHEERQIVHLTTVELKRHEMKVSTNTEINAKKALFVYVVVSPQQFHLTVDNGDLYGDFNMRRIEKISLELNSKRRNIQHKTEMISEREGEFKLASKTQVDSKTILTFNGKLLTKGHLEFQLNGDQLDVKIEAKNFRAQLKEDISGRIFIDAKRKAIFYDGKFQLSQNELKVEVDGKYNNEKTIDVRGSIDLSKQSEVVIKSKWLEGKIMYTPEQGELKQILIKLDGKNLPKKYRTETLVKIHQTRGWVINSDNLIHDQKVKIGSEINNLKKINFKVESPVGNGKVEFDGEGSFVTLKYFLSDDRKSFAHQGIFAYNKNEKRGKFSTEHWKNQQTEIKVEGDFRVDQPEGSFTVAGNDLTGKFNAKLNEQQGNLNFNLKGRGIIHVTELRYDQQSLQTKSSTKYNGKDLLNIMTDLQRNGKSQLGVLTPLFKAKFELDAQNTREMKVRAKIDSEKYQIQHETEVLYNKEEAHLTLRSKTLKEQQPLFRLETELNSGKVTVLGETQRRIVRVDLNRRQVSATIRYEDKQMKNKFLISAVAAGQEKMAFRTELEMNGKLMGKLDVAASLKQESHFVGQMGKNKIQAAINLVEPLKTVRLLVETRDINLKHETQLRVVDEEHATLKSNTLYNREALLQLDAQLALQEVSKINFNSRWVEIKTEFKVIERTLDMNILKKVGEKRRILIHTATINPLYQEQYGFEFEVKHDADRDQDKVVALTLLWKNVKGNTEFRSEIRFNNQFQFLAKVASNENTCDLVLTGKLLDGATHSVYVKREKNGERMKITGNYQKEKVNKFEFQLDLTTPVLTRTHQLLKGQLVLKSVNKRLDGLVINIEHQLNVEQRQLKLNLKLVTPEQKKYGLALNLKQNNSDLKYDFNGNVELNAPTMKSYKGSVAYSFEKYQTLKVKVQSQLNDQPETGMRVELSIAQGKYQALVKVATGKQSNNLVIKGELNNSMPRKLLLQGKLGQNMVEILGLYQNRNRFQGQFQARLADEKYDAEVKAVPQGNKTSFTFNAKRNENRIVKLDINVEHVNNGEIITVSYNGPISPVNVKLTFTSTETGLNYNGDVCVGTDSQCYKFEALYQDQPLGHGQIDKVFNVMVVNLKNSQQYSLSWNMKWTPNEIGSKTLLTLNQARYGYEFNAQQQSLNLQLYLVKRVAQLQVSRQMNGQNLLYQIVFLPNAEQQPEEKTTLQLEVNPWWRSAQQYPLENIEARVSFLSNRLQRPLELKLKTIENERKLNIYTHLDVFGEENNMIIFQHNVERLEGGKQTWETRLYNKDEKHLNVRLITNVDLQANQHVIVKTEWTWLDHNGSTVSGKIHIVLDAENLEINVESEMPYFGTVKIVGKLITTNGNGNSFVFRVNITRNRQEPTALVGSLDFDQSSASLMFNYYENEVATRRNGAPPQYHFEASAKTENNMIFKILAESLHQGERVKDVSIVFDKTNGKVLRMAIHWKPDLLKKRIRAFSQMMRPENMKRLGLEKLADEIAAKKKAFTPSLKSNMEPWWSSMKEQISEWRNEFEQQSAPLKRTLRQVRDQAQIKAVPVWVKDVLHQAALWVADQLLHSCPQQSVCHDLAYAYQQHGWQGLTQEVHVLERLYKQKWQNLEVEINQLISKLPQSVQVLIKQLEHVIDKILSPIHENEIIQKTVREVRLLKRKADEKITATRKQFIQRLKDVRQAILKNEDLRIVWSVIMQIYHEIENEIRKTDYAQVENMALEATEVFFRPSSWFSNSRVMVFSPKTGRIEIELREPTQVKALRSIIRRTKETLKETSPIDMLTEMHENEQQGEWLPPYEAQAMIIAGQHYVTFDGRHFDFAAKQKSCEYQLAKDNINNNFTVSVRYQEPQQGQVRKVYIVRLGDDVIEMDTQRKSVKINNQETEQSTDREQYQIHRQHDSIIVRPNNQVASFECYLKNDICVLKVNGWLFGKTNGLFGNNDNDASNDWFNRENEKTENFEQFIASWSANKQCRNENVAHREMPSEQSKAYQYCAQLFKSEESPLADAFQSVNPNEWFDICAKHSASVRGKRRSSCAIAEAYARKAQQERVRIELPAECLACEDKQKLGERRKMAINEKKADYVFLVEENRCSRDMINQLPEIARMIEKESGNQGISTPRFGLVGMVKNSIHFHTARDERNFPASNMPLAIKGIRQSETQDEEKETKANLLDMIAESNHAYPWRQGVAKNLIVISCSKTNENSRLDFNDIQSVLTSQGVVLHYVSNARLAVSRKVKSSILAIDARTVFEVDSLKQNGFTGDQNLRKHVKVPKDITVALSLASNGSYFDMEKSTQNNKVWKAILARRVVKTAQPDQCQECFCLPTRDGLSSRSLCSPCKPRSPIY